jgi:hypothetical protein
MCPHILQPTEWKYNNFSCYWFYVNCLFIIDIIENKRYQLNKSKLFEVRCTMGYIKMTNSQGEIRCIMGYTKMTNFDKCWWFQNLHCLRIHNFKNFAQPKIRSLSYFFLHSGRVHTSWIFFRIYWNFEMLILNFRKKQAPCSPRAPKCLTPFVFHV